MTRYGGGIINLGETCYASSCLQLILRFDPLFSTISSIKSKSKNEVALQDFLDFRKSFLESPSELNPAVIYNYFEIFPSGQEDAAEFMSKFFDKLISMFPKNKSRISNFFNIQLQSNWQIPSESLIFLPINAISNVPFMDLVTESFDSLQQRITYSPPLFFIQIKRFYFQKETQLIKKRKSPVLFTEKFNATSFGGAKYTLFGIILHSGNPYRGHYTSLVRDKHGWILTNDSEIQSYTFNLSDYTSEDSKLSSTPYILAYVQDIRQIHVVRNHLLIEPRKVLNFLYFDPILMKKREIISMEMPPETELFRMIRSVFQNITDEKLTIMYEYPKKVYSPDFPVLTNKKSSKKSSKKTSKSNQDSSSETSKEDLDQDSNDSSDDNTKTEEDEIIINIWAQPSRYPFYPPIIGKLKPIWVDFEVFKSPITWKTLFSSHQTFKSIYNHCLDVYEEFLNRECSDLNFYLKLESGLAPIPKKKSTSKLTMQDFLDISNRESVRFIISDSGLIPKKSKINIQYVETRKRFKIIEDFTIPVEIKKDISDLLEEAKDELETDSVLPWGLTLDNKLIPLKSSAQLTDLMSFEVIRFEVTRKKRTNETLFVQCDPDYPEIIAGALFRFELFADESLIDFISRLKKYVGGHWKTAVFYYPNEKGEFIESKNIAKRCQMFEYDEIRFGVLNPPKLR